MKHLDFELLLVPDQRLVGGFCYRL